MQAEYRLLEISCGEKDEGITAGQLLRSRGISRRLTVLLKRTEQGITRDGRLCRTVDTVHEGDIIRLRIPQDNGGKTFAPEPKADSQVKIAFEDEDIVVFDKPSGMPVHESALHRGDTLANVFAAMYPGLPFRSVNRLDRDTSGLCLAAKNRHSANISREHIHKTYYAVCEGVITEPFTVNAPIAREKESMIKRVVRDDGKESVTHAVPLENNGIHTLLEITLETGRTHQIRVHMAHIGHPLAGDDLYGGSREFIGRQALHCGKISFVHPVTGKSVKITLQLPNDIVQLIQSVR